MTEHRARLSTWAICFLAATWACRAGAETASMARNPIALEIPLRCTVGADCWVAHYLDADPSPRASDFNCGPRSYDGHDGVDFAIRDLGVMLQGVPVLASADGVVRGVRDGMADVALSDAASRASVTGRECGNGVVLDHPNGWQTQYCHMRRGSIRVKAGEHVGAGSQLGLVGLSGQTEFPHLHLSVRHSGASVDPFTGAPASKGCKQAGNALWKRDAGIGYEPVALYNAGVSSGPPDITAIRSGQHDDAPLPVTAAALVVWVDMFGVQAGDRIRFALRASDGRAVIDTEVMVEKTQARRFSYAGSRLAARSWAPGDYDGAVTLRRIQTDKRILTRSIPVHVTLR